MKALATYLKMTVPVFYRGRGEGSITSYDFVDILRGRAYDTYTGALVQLEETVYEEYDVAGDGNTTIDSDSEQVCQTFTIGTTGTDEDFYVTGVELFCTTSNSNYWREVVIQATSGGEPDGTDIAVSRVTTTNVDNADSWLKVSFDNVGKLSAGTQYAIVVRHNYNNGTFNWRHDDAPGTYTGGSAGTSADSGANWTMDTSKDMVFKVIGNTTNPLMLLDGITGGVATWYAEPMVDFANQHTFEFDLEIGKQAILQGWAFIDSNLTIAESTATDYTQAYITSELLHVDASGTETSLGTATTDVDLTVDVGAFSFRKMAIFIENNTVFKNTDSLRLKIKPYMRMNDDSGVHRFTLSYGSCGVTIPFKLDI